jgi:hypothetical protein
MKIFEIQWKSQDEKEWVAANTTIEALKVYCSITGMDLINFEDDDEIVEIPKEKWKEMTVFNWDYDPENPEDNWKEKSFEQWMEEHSDPDIIAGTMYE